MLETKSMLTSEFKIGSILVKPQTREVIIDEESKQLQPRVMKLLCYLASNQGKVISLDELMLQVWEGMIVSDVAIHRAISVLRQCFSDNPKEPVFIETIVKTGYRLMIPVKVINQHDKPLALNTSQNNLIIIIMIIVTAIISVWFVSSKILSKNQQIVTPKINIPKFTYLTSHEGLEDKPRFSQDGKSIVYTQLDNDGQVGSYLIDLDKSRTPYKFDIEGSNTDTVWSSDGNSFYSTIRTATTCQIMRHSKTDGISQKINDCLTKQSYLFEMDASPDGEKIIISEKDYLNKKASRRKLYLLNINSGARTTLTQPTKGQGDFTPRYSQDGKKLVFLRLLNEGTKEVMLLDLETNDLQQLTHDDAKITGLDWTADGRIVFVSNRAGESSLWMIDLNDKKVQWLNVIIENLNHIDISKDNKLVFQTKFRPYNIVITDLKQQHPSNFKQLTHTRKANTFPVLSPDGQYIAYISDKSGRLGIWLSDSDGENARILTEDAISLSAPEWSPDSSQIAYVSAKNGNRDICLVDINAQQSCVLHSKGDELFPTWSRDGKILYFIHRSDVNAPRYLMKMNLITNKVTNMNNIIGLVLQESKTEKNIAYYIDLYSNKIMKLNTVTWESTAIVDDRKVDYFKSWNLSNEGIYYIDLNKKLKFHSFVKQNSEILNDYSTIGYFSYSGLNIDPNNKKSMMSLTLLSSKGDVGVIENFSELLPRIQK